MRVLCLNHNVAGSGTYQRALNVARQAVARGHRATLVTTSRTRMLRGGTRAVDGVEVIEAPDLLRGGARNGWDPWNTMWRTQRLVREPFDLIHAFDSRPAVIVPALAARTVAGAPLFLDWADWWGRGGVIGERSGPVVRTLFGPVETWFEESFRTRATANTVISDALRDRCAELGVTRDRILTMPNGCTPPDPASAADRTIARRELGLQERTPLIVHVGAMHRADGELLFSAFERVRKALPHARLVLVGNSRAPSAANDGPGVVRTGYVSDAELARLLAAADIGVVVMRDNIASRARWPGKMNDYLSAGLPIVMPRVGAAAEYIDRYGTGRTSDATPDSFGDAMIEMAADPAGLASARERALALAAGDLSWVRVTDDLFEFYGRWCSEATAGRTQFRTVSAT